MNPPVAAAPAAPLVPPTTGVVVVNCTAEATEVKPITAAQASAAQ